jgi:Flp pilus assembly protein TadG
MARFPGRSRIALSRLGLEDRRGSVMVEFAFVFPILIALLGLVLMAGQGLEVSRKVTMTARTLTDLASQQSNIGTSSGSYNYTQILNAAALVIAHYSASSMTMTVSEIQVTGANVGTVIWSEAYNGGGALTTGANVALSGNLPVSQYIIQGTVTYTFSPLSTIYLSTPITLSDTVAMAPRISTSVACCN